jgi:hypothetical protein
LSAVGRGASNRAGRTVKRETLKWLSDLALAAGFLAAAVLLIGWFPKGGRDRAHAERLAIFVGLWGPSLFASSHRLAHAAEEADWGALEQKRGLRKLATDFLAEVAVAERS